MVEFNEEKSFASKSVKFFKNNVDTFAIVLIAIVYIFAGSMRIIPSGNSLSSIISSSVLNLIVGIVIKALMRSKGLKDAQNSEVFLNTVFLYGQKLDKNTDKITKLDLYCDFHNARKLKQKQIRYLRKYGLSYDKFINGEYETNVEFKKINEKCKKIKIHELNSSMMLNAIDIVDVDEKISNTTPHQYQARGVGSNLIIGFLCAFLFSYYMLEPGSLNWSMVLWASLLIVLNIIFGIMSYTSAVSFIKNELRTRIKYIINCFDEFESLEEKGYFKYENELKLIKMEGEENGIKNNI